VRPAEPHWLKILMIFSFRRIDGAQLFDDLEPADVAWAMSIFLRT